MPDVARFAFFTSWILSLLVLIAQSQVLLPDCDHQWMSKRQLALQTSMLLCNVWGLMQHWPLNILYFNIPDISSLIIVFILLSYH